VRARAPGSSLIIARAGDESAIASVAVLPAAVASVSIEGARALKVGDSLDLRAEPRDQNGRALAERPVTWASSDLDIAAVDSESGVVVARGAGNADITAMAEGKSGKVRVTVLPQPRTSRTEVAGDESRRAPETPPADAAAQRLLLVDQVRAGVERCYSALAQKDVKRVEEMYQPTSKADYENLKRLSRILRTGEWQAQVGEREDGAQRIGATTASMEFAIRLAWKDAFGGRLASRPVFRAEFVKNGDKFDLASCQMVGSPEL
jgi:Bacterial Ig-like domain (group 2)